MYRYGAIAAIACAFPFVASAATCPSLSRGSTGSAVTAVQHLLFDTYKGFPAPTGYFGPTTEAAVKQWQAEHGIEAIGTVGPKTAAALRIDLCAGVSAASSTSPANSNQPLINALLAQLKALQAQLAALLAGGSVTRGVATSTALAVTGGGGSSSPQSLDNFAPSAVQATPGSGTYQGGIAVTLGAAEATSIRYTADGSTPTCSSGYVYGSNGANYLYIGSSMTIQAVACNASGASALATFAYTITPKGPCDDGWTLVPGNGRLGTGNFCVMQFQAQNPLGWMENLKATGDLTLNPNVGSTETTWIASARVLSQQPVSKYSGASMQYAWNYITAKQAAVACQSIGAKLMDVPHAQTINLNVAAQPTNWQSGVVGRGCLFGGNMDGRFWDANEPVPAPHGDDATADPYEYLGIDPSAIAAKTPTCPFPKIGSGVSGGYAERRSFYLSNGGIVWDWSGNLGEWLANILPNNATSGPSYFTAPGGNGMGYWDWNITDNHDGVYTDWSKSYLADLERPWIGPFDPAFPILSTLTEQNGIGGYYGPNNPGNGAYRGGSYYKGKDAGIFHIDIGHPPTFSNVQIGFRCYKAVGVQPPPLFASPMVTD